jgi:glycosyltransferase involved in cell wall biosynthesis
MASHPLRVDTPPAPPDDPAAADPELELSIVMPCLNERDSLGACIRKASHFLEAAAVRGEVIVADNGSVDGSIELAESLGARVVRVSRRGYGAALAGGFSAARGRFLIMGDADDTYDFSRLSPFLQQLREGADVVIGNRFRGGIEAGAMPLLHRYVGNPALSSLARFLFRSSCGDVYCGLRGLTKSAYHRLGLQSVGMEYALEMVAKASLLGMKVAEVPTRLSRDRRGRVSHLRTWTDGRRSIRTYMLFSPNWLFLYPGVVLMLAGLSLGVWILATPAVVGGVRFSVHSLLYASTMILLGFQAVCFSVFTRVISVSAGFSPADPLLKRLVARLRLEHGLAVGAGVAAAGVAATFYNVWMWEQHRFGDLDPFRVMRVAIPAVLSIALGLQAVLASLFLSLLKVQFLETGRLGLVAAGDPPGDVPPAAERAQRASE